MTDWEILVHRRFEDRLAGPEELDAVALDAVALEDVAFDNVTLDDVVRPQPCDTSRPLRAKNFE